MGFSISKGINSCEELEPKHTTMKEEMQEMVRAHFKLLAQFADVKLWIWTALTTTVLTWIEQYVYRDWEFLKFLLVLMVLDLLTGVLNAFLKKEAVTSFGFRKTVLKAVQYGVFLIVMHVLSSFTINGETQSIYHWVTQGAYIFLLGIEGKSILENIAKLNSSFDLSEYLERIKSVFTKKKE